jgi:hypothetical protein
VAIRGWQEICKIILSPGILAMELDSCIRPQFAKNLLDRRNILYAQIEAQLRTGNADNELYSPAA